MAMREECKHYQSRTYASGEVARFCVLDLAPEAPWRCPEACRRYEPRRADVAWTHGSLVEPPIEEEPLADDEPAGDVARLLDEAENAVNAVGPQVRAEVASLRRQQDGSAWRRTLRRLGGRRREGDEPGFGGRR